MGVTIKVNAASPETLEVAKQAASEIFSDSNASFEKIKNRPWYKSLLNSITFQQGDKKLIVRNVRSLASLQSLFMEVYANQLKSQDAELDGIVQQILNTQQVAYKIYNSCVLQLKPQTDMSALSGADQQILLLLLSEFNCSNCLDAEEHEKLQQYNWGVSSSLDVSRPISDLNSEQLEKVQYPDVFYRCVLEQCAVTNRLEPLSIPDNVYEAIQWLDISEKKKERTLAAVKTEINDYGISSLFGKYKRQELIFDENDLELAEDTPEKFDDEESAEQVSAPNSDVSGHEKDASPFHQLFDVIQRYVMTGKLGKPLLKALSEMDKNKLIAKVLPNVLPVSKTVIEIAKLKNGHLVFTTSAMYWATNTDVKKVPYSELKPNYLGIKPIDIDTAFVYSSDENKPIEIMDSNLSAELLEQLLLKINKIGEYAEADVLTEFKDLPQEVQFDYMRFVANIIKESGHPLHEVYRLAVQYGLNEHWGYISSEFETSFRDAFRAYSEKIPYPNEDALAISMLKDICTIYQYTKDSDILKVPEKKYFPLVYNGSTADRDAIIRFAQLEKQTIEQRIDAKNAKEVTDAFSIAVGAVLWFKFIPKLGTLISAAVVGGGIAKTAVINKYQKQSTKTEMRQKVQNKVMQSYQRAEETAKNQGLTEFADLLRKEAITIAHKIGFQYGERTQEERRALTLIQISIAAKLGALQETLSKHLRLAKDLSMEDKRSLLSGLAVSGYYLNYTDIIALYNQANSKSVSEKFTGMLFLSDCIYYRKRKSDNAQRMSYFNMLKIEKNWNSAILRGRNGDIIALDKSFPFLSMLEGIIDIVNEEI